MSFASKLHNNRIAWYPSSYADFRPLLYLNPASQDERSVSMPDVFLFSDINETVSDKWVSGNKVLYEDSRTKLTATSVELIDILTLPARRKLIHSNDAGGRRNHVYRLNVLVESKKFSPSQATIYYAFCENTALARYLIDIHAQVSHLVRVCYGDAFGGSAASGAWLFNIISELGTECLISDKPISWYLDRINWREADEFAVKYFRFPSPNQNLRFEETNIVSWRGTNTYWNIIHQSNFINGA